MGARVTINLGEEAYTGTPWTAELIETLIGKPVTLPGGAKVGEIVRAFPMQGGGAACEAELVARGAFTFVCGEPAATRIELGA